MKKVRIDELNADCQLISSYADLKGNPLKLVRMAYLNPHSMDVKLALLRDLFIAPAEVWQQLEKEENRDQLWRLIQALDWVFKGPEHRPVLFLRLRGKSFFLPDENLFHLSTAEFVIATAHLIGFHTAKDDVTAVENLNKFTATIARPKPDVLDRIRKVDDGDPREVFSSVKAERRAKLFTKIDTVMQILIAQWFNNAANRLLKSYGMLSGDPDAAPISQGVFVQDWERQVVKVAESGVYGNYDAVMSRSIAEVLSYIDLKNEELRRKNSK